eukprot:2614467-Ditylum_brightwellii.AAC.1
MGSELWIATDGSVKGPLGYFGWVIATKSQILCERYGHSQGNPELVESLRAESTALLVVGKFLYRRIQYRDILPYTGAIVHFCNNSTLHKRMAHNQAGQKQKPMENILADIDLQLQIEATFASLNLDISTNHVKGHQ